MQDGRPIEPTPPLPPGPAEARLNRGLNRAANMLTSLVGFLLLVFVIVAIGGVVVDLWDDLSHGHRLSQAALRGIDSAFLAIILIELVHTTLSRGALVTQVLEFLVIGITAGVRSGLEIVAGAAERPPHDIVIDVAINAGAVLLLVVAYVLARRSVPAA